MTRIIVALIALSLLTAGCSLTSVEVSGGSTSTPNERIAGVVIYPEGDPVADAAVTMRRIDYVVDPWAATVTKRNVSSLNGTTDAKGGFVLDSVDSGTYAIEVNDGKGYAVLLQATMGPAGESVLLPTATARRVGSVSGEVTLAQQERAEVYVQVVGLERLVRIDSAAGGFSLTDLPVGVYELHIVTRTTQAAPRIVSDVGVASEAVVTIGEVELPALSGWAHARPIYLNTTTTGADVATDVTNFPVLVRLSDATFDFSQARADGADLRFTKPDSASLPFEIELWDAAAGQAAIWVRLDTVRGNSDTQYFTMAWGNPAAQDRSDPAAVFDTAGGFQGVWHLGQASGSPVLDATANRYDGTPSTPAPATVEGAIGGAQQFDGAQTCIQMHNTAHSRLSFAENGPFCLSAWVNTDSLDVKPHLIAGKGHQAYYLKLMSGPYIDNLWEFVNFREKLGWEITEDSTMARAEAWIHLVGVRDGDRQYLYQNGVLIDSTTRFSDSDSSRIDSEDFSIGRYLSYVNYTQDEGYCPFSGRIDEVRAMSVAPDAAWIRLCYMNQGGDDKLVVFK